MILVDHASRFLANKPLSPLEFRANKRWNDSSYAVVSLSKPLVADWISSAG